MTDLEQTVQGDATQDKIALSRCPFCGSDNVAFHGATAIYVVCLDCEASSGCYPSRQEAAAAWNRSAGDGNPQN